MSIKQKKFRKNSSQLKKINYILYKYNFVCKICNRRHKSRITHHARFKKYGVLACNTCGTLIKCGCNPYNRGINPFRIERIYRRKYKEYKIQSKD